MTFQLRAVLAFTDSRPTIDRMGFDPDSDVTKGDWKRLTRTMKGERTGRHQPYLVEWDEATPNTRHLAEATDKLADERLWFDVGVLPGLWNCLGHSTNTEPAVAEGVLVVLLMEDGWNPDRKPKSVYINWLNSALYANNPEALAKGIEETQASCGSVATLKSIEAHVIDTTTGTCRQLEVDVAAFLEPAPAIA